MFRKLLAMAALAVVSLLLLPGMASATDYVPPPVDPSSSATSTIAVLGTSQTLTSSTQGGATGPLAYTGSGINVGLVVLIGLIILVVGGALIVAGSKLTKRGSQHH